MLVRAHTADYAQQESLPLPLDFDELLSTVSEAFALQRGSVRIRSKHAPTDLWVVLASQSQLMDAVREASESAMHMLTIEVSGRSARRTLDGLMFVLDLARLGAQVAYLWWLSQVPIKAIMGTCKKRLPISVTAFAGTRKGYSGTRSSRYGHLLMRNKISTLEYLTLTQLTQHERSNLNLNFARSAKNNIV